MQLEMAGQMADYGFKLSFNLEKIVTTSNFELFSYGCALAALATGTPRMPGQFAHQTLTGVRQAPPTVTHCRPSSRDNGDIQLR